jgi:serine/threonine protein kinase
VLDALVCAHAHGIVHRDVKPANVMLTDDGAIKVMDFGIARPLDCDSGMTLTRTSMVIGTAAYLSPEQARGQTVDARSDLYSVGCLLYELLTGRPPFVGDGPLEVAWHHLQTWPEPPSAHASAVPRRLDELVLRALEKDRALRFGSADEMRDALDDCLRSLTVRSPLPAQQHSQSPLRPTLLQPNPQSKPNLQPQQPRHPQQQPAASRRERSRPRRSVARRVLLSLAACAAAVTVAGGYAAAHSGRSTGQQVRSPALTGRTLFEAKVLARTSGLHVSTVTTGGCPQPGVAAHRVCSQRPAPGSPVARGAGIELVLAPAGNP